MQSSFYDTHKKWQLLLVATVIAFSALLYSAGKNLDYNWSWQRVPDYFFFKKKESIRAENYGQVEAINAQKGASHVVIITRDGKRNTLTVDTHTVNISSYDDVFAGDELGSISYWTMGPLTKGLLTTIWLSFTAGTLGLILATFMAFARISSNPFIKGLAKIYVEIIRGTPLLVQLFIIYFFFGTILSLNRYVAGVGALALFAGAYFTEILRGGIQNVSKGQREAAAVLGLNKLQTITHVVIPQAFKRSLPALAGQFINLVKDSSLVSVIAIYDLTKAGREVVSSTFASFEVWFTVAFLYLFLTMTLSWVAHKMEKRWAIND